MQAIEIKKTGGPDVLEIKYIKLENPKANEVLIKHTAIGLNYIDTYHRSGLYPVPLPSGIGLEASGVIEKVGEGVVGAGKFLGKKVGEQQEKAKQKREEASQRRTQANRLRSEAERILSNADSMDENADKLDEIANDIDSSADNVENNLEIEKALDKVAERIKELEK